jgi:hypothetical protein
VSPRLVETVSTGRELATDDAQPARHGESVAKLLEVMRSALCQPRLGRRRQATDDRTYNLPVVIPVRGAVMNNRFANAQGGSASQYMLVIGRDAHVRDVNRRCVMNSTVLAGYVLDC